MQVVICNWVGDPFKAWVAGSSLAALTKISKYFSGFGRAVFGPTPPSKRDSGFYAVSITPRTLANTTLPFLLSEDWHL